MIESRIKIHVCNAFVRAALCSFLFWVEGGGRAVAIIIIILFEVSFGCFLLQLSLNASPVVGYVSTHVHGYLPAFPVFYLKS